MSGFCKNAKFVGMDQITSKNCIKSIWMQVNKILLTRDRPEQFPSFFVCSFQWNQSTMRWSRVPKAYHFLWPALKAMSSYEPCWLASKCSWVMFLSRTYVLPQIHVFVIMKTLLISYLLTKLKIDQLFLFNTKQSAILIL